MSLIIYDSNKTNLSPISFINDLKNQTAIRDLDTNSENFKKQLGFIFSKISNLLGVKQTILDINKRDIVDMLSMRFKGLSLDEIDYAFKLERYGSLNRKTEHFQLINADYVSTVLDKYMAWKEFKIKNNIKVKKILKENELSESEKLKINKQAVTKQLNYFLEHRQVDESRIYVYDIFDKIGLMPTDKEYKESVKKDAVEILKKEYANKKANSRDENKKIREVLNGINEGKSSKIILKCKQIALEDLLRKEIKSKEDVVKLVDSI